MNFYLDIRIKPDAEMRQNLLLNKVYIKLHKALCDLQATDIGVSFPEYRVVLGEVIRVHSTRERLNALQATGWLGRLVGYCVIADIQTVPELVEYRTLFRARSNMTESKLRRLMKRGSITGDEVKAYRVKMFGSGLTEPYLELESNSNGHKHRRYIAFGELLDSSIPGEFDQFGLSKTATIPWF